jgi:hypothetical protein
MDAAYSTQLARKGYNSVFSTLFHVEFVFRGDIFAENLCTHRQVVNALSIHRELPA